MSIYQQCGVTAPHCAHKRFDHDERAWVYCDGIDAPQIPDYLKPAPLSNGVMDRCAATENGTRCQWRRHFGHTHSFSQP